jgi:hypothetical protein
MTVTDLKDAIAERITANRDNARFSSLQPLFEEYDNSQRRKRGAVPDTAAPSSF